LRPVAAEVGEFKLGNIPNCLKLMTQWLECRAGTEIANNDDVRK